MRFVMFSKTLQALSVLEAGQAVKSLGFDGIQLTVRRKGHVLPEHAREALPRAIDELRGIGLDVPSVVTDIRNLQDEHAHDVCETAARLGIRRLRTAPHTYKPFGTIRQQIAEAHRDAAELERLGREHGVMFCIQTHSGSALGAQGGILDQILHGTDPRYVGVSLDPGHLMVEGGNMGWVESIDLLQDRIGLVDAKTYGWFSERDPDAGDVIWENKILPLDQGMVRWHQVFALLRQVGWDQDGQALVSLGTEYVRSPQGGGDPDPAEVIEQTRNDLAYIRREAERAAQPGSLTVGKKSKKAEPLPS